MKIIVNHLILIGFMGTGKTTIGKALHKLLQLPWIDTDSYLGNRWGMSVNMFFSQYGEEAFRNEETSVLREVLNHPVPIILSTGGGITLKEENQLLLLQHKKKICLTADIEHIYTRLNQDNSRPLVKNFCRMEIEKLYLERVNTYKIGDYEINTSCMGIEEVVENVLAFWKRT